MLCLSEIRITGSDHVLWVKQRSLVYFRFLSALELKHSNIPLIHVSAHRISTKKFHSVDLNISKLH